MKNLDSILLASFIIGAYLYLGLAICLDNRRIIKANKKKYPQAKKPNKVIIDGKLWCQDLDDFEKRISN